MIRQQQQQAEAQARTARKAENEEGRPKRLQKMEAKVAAFHA
jgi:hypothetical protein